jgi:branched-chain amino acid transport system substrate-binding protein
MAHQIWMEDVNQRGGLLGKPVELVCFDDATEAERVRDIYARLLDEEKVDLVIGSYGTNSLLPAMPLIIERGRFFVGLMGVGVNQQFCYPGYFALIPMGPNPNAALTEGFFAVATRQSPRPTTVALLYADAEFARNPILGARANAEKYGFVIVDERTYPLSTEDFAPVVEAAMASAPDLLVLCSYLTDSVGLVRAVARSNVRPKMVGGAMIGPQNTAVKTTLGPLLNGFVNYEYWAPVPAMMGDGVNTMLKAYQARAAESDVDLLGHYMAPTAYSQLQVLEQTVQETGSLNDAQLINYARSAVFDTVLGKIQFGRDGEWSSPRVLQVQFDGIKGHDLEQFKRGDRQVVVAPDDLASGPLAYPYAQAVASSVV